MTGRRPQRTIFAALAAILAAIPPALAGGPLVCVAPTDPADAGKPLQDIVALEFYADEGNPALSFSVPLKRIRSNVEPDGRVTNGYRVKDADTVGATIVFVGATPLSFAVIELGASYLSLDENEEETAFMADAVPGVVCYSASKEALQVPIAP